MNDNIYCRGCDYSIVYDDERTLFLQCPSCGKVLIDRKAEEVWKEPLSVASYGKNSNGFWIKIEDGDGRVHMCWKS